MAGKERKHVVKKGESIKSIAKKYKYEKWQILWDDPKNKHLKKKWKAEAQKAKKAKGKEPELVNPGDVLFLPFPKWVLKELDKVVLNMNLHRNKLLETRGDIKASIADLKKRNGYIQFYMDEIDRTVTTKVAEIRKYMKKAETARDHADLIQSFATMYKTMAKHGLKASVKGFQKMFSKKADNVAAKALTQAEKKIAKEAALKAQKDFGKGMLQDQYDGLYSILVDVGAKETSATSKVGKALRFADDATSVAHYMWITTRALSGGGVSWSSIKQDADKKVNQLVKLGIGYKKEMRDAMNVHKGMISTLESQLANIRKQIADVESKSADIIAVMNT